MYKAIPILFFLLCSVFSFTLHCSTSTSSNEGIAAVSASESAEEILEIMQHIEEHSKDFRSENITSLSIEEKYTLFALFIEYIVFFPDAFDLVIKNPAAYINNIFCPYLNLFSAAYEAMDTKFLSEIKSEIQKNNKEGLFNFINPGEALDPTYLFCSALNDFYIHLIASGRINCPRFNEYLSQGLMMMRAKGKDHYGKDGLYQNFLMFLFTEQIKNIIKKCESDTDFLAYKQELAAYSQSFVRESMATPSNMPLHILAYTFRNEKHTNTEFSKKTLQTISDMHLPQKLILLEQFSLQLLTQKKYKLVENMLGCMELSGFTSEHDSLLIPFLLAKVFMGQTIDDYAERLSSVNQTNTVQKANLFSIYCRIGNAEKAKALLELLVQHHFLDENTALSLLAQFRDIFIYNMVAENQNFEHVDTNNFKTITGFYEQMAAAHANDTDKSIYKVVLRNLFKLYLVAGLEKETAENLDKLAQCDEKFSSYKTVSQESQDEADKIKSLKNLTHIIDLEEEVLLEYFHNQRLNVFFAGQDKQLQQKAVQDKQNKKAELEALEQAKLVKESMKRITTLNAIELKQGEKINTIKDVPNINLENLPTVLKNETIFYIYCNEATLNLATPEEIEKFKKALEESEFAEKEGDIGVKYLSADAYELKIKGAARIFGFMREATVIKNGKSDGMVKIIHFCTYHADPHKSDRYYKSLISHMNNLSKASKGN